MHSPRTIHLDAIFQILRYLKSNPRKGLLFSNNEHLGIEAFADSDWAGSPNDKISTSDFCAFVGRNLVTWISKKQSIVARSSAEA